MYARNRKSGIAIAGTLERLSGVAHINADSFKRGEDGKLAFEQSGWTEVHWNGQRTATDEHDRTLFVDDDGGEVTVEDIELTETDPRGEGAAFAPARKTGREVLGDERAIELWGSLEAVPSCPVCACHGPEGDGDASHVDLTTNADAYSLCEACRTALRETRTSRLRRRRAVRDCGTGGRSPRATGFRPPMAQSGAAGEKEGKAREGSVSGMRGPRRADVGVGRHAGGLGSLRAESGDRGVPERHRPVQGRLWGLPGCVPRGLHRPGRHGRAADGRGAVGAHGRGGGRPRQVRPSPPTRGGGS